MPSNAASRGLADLRGRLPALMLRDVHRLERRLAGARRVRDDGALSGLLATIADDVAAAERRVERRRSRMPTPTYPESLPVSARRDDILAAIRDHQVVIVAGETGSGKTTQLPKICLDLGRGVRGVIGHTQPRRIAARAVAERIAEELSTPVGDVVGYTVRFSDKSSDNTLVKVMTDGILLAEIQGDRMLRRYDTLIIDEAHERSLNIDFILGYVKQLLPNRPDLKVVITSATIDTERFAAHFDGAPVVEVSGRTYPVEVRYRPITDPADDGDDKRDPPDQVQAICDAVGEVAREGPGDMLVFLSGEREIKDTAEALRRMHLRDTEVLPLYARLSAAEQHRVFTEHEGRRVVLATNVAETSLTVPGIRYVVDPGTARISRYSNRTKVQRLPIERVSQASANQRKGRCGRVSDGICIRLYSETDFAGRPEFTEPEILRTNLASVILQMAALGLGEVTDFPFLDPPDRRQIRDGVQLLEELGALDPKAADPRERLTTLGRRLAQLPVDPRIGRMVLESDRNGCLAEVIVIAAGLSIQDPRERPADKQEAAAQKHARFVDKDSDFVGYLNLWNYLQEQQHALSSSAFRRLCRTDFLSYLRVREWQDLVSQLQQIAKSLGLTPNVAPGTSENVHRSLLSGLLSHIGMKSADRHDYLGARGARFAIFPGSGLFKRSPRWLMSAELVETTRLWARINARIEPEWVEPLAEHLVTRSYSEPHWEKDRGAVMALEKVTLYGVPIIPARKVNFARIDPELARDLFIRHALVEGEWRTHHTFWHENHRRLQEVEALEDRTRRRDLVVDEETLLALYDARVPAHVVSQRHFDSWWKSARRSQPDLLTFTTEMLVNEGIQDVGAHDYPDAWRVGEVELPLSYRFEPGAPDDGVTVTIPVALLNRLDTGDFDWQVPGLREDLVVALIRSLPKALRRGFVPAPDHARAALAQLTPRRGQLADALARELGSRAGARVTSFDWDWDKVPSHLRMTLRVVGADGRTLAEGKDLDKLKHALAPKIRSTVSEAAARLERDGLRTWDFDTLPRTFEGHRHGHAITGFPALIDDGDSVRIQVLDSVAAQQASHRLGVRRLLLLDLPSPLKSVVRLLANDTKLALGRSAYASVPALLADCEAGAVDSLIDENGGPVWDAATFRKLRESVRADLHDRLLDVVTTVGQILGVAHQVEVTLSGQSSLALLPTLTDVRDQLSRLVRDGFVSATGWPRLVDVARYVHAMQVRLDRLPGRIDRDRQLTATVCELEDEWRQLAGGAPLESPPDDELAQVRWMLEELRVSLFAQTVGTAYPVSEKRVLRALDELTA